jgi:hypothetical protein
MDGLEVAVAVFLGLWLAALTLVLILVIRQIGLLTVRFGLEESEKGISFADRQLELAQEGPPIGSRISREVLFDMPELQQGANLLLLVSAHCQPCRDLASEIGQQGETWASSDWKLLALVPGREELADEVAALLPSSAWVIKDPEAENVARRLGFETVPTAIAVVDGVVTAKAALPIMHGAADVLPLLDSLHPNRVPVSPVGG